MIQELSMQDFDYELPPSKIAQQALEPRDSSKLLVFRNNTINDTVFKNISAFIPAGSSLFYNDAKVIPARIFVKKESGTTIEIFLLKPYLSDYFTVLNTTASCQWECMVGNKRKWKDGESLTLEVSIDGTPLHVTLHWHDRFNNIVRMEWPHEKKFTELLEQIGRMPLPPYIKREAELNDKNRYQTIYSSTEGAVAAPTAGLHFTEEVIQDLKHQNIRMNPLTLHVSAGTFLPVSVDNASEHDMHQEIFSVNRTLLEQLKNAQYPIAVGTTSVRVLESLYRCAMNLMLKKEQPFLVEKLSPYEPKEPALTSAGAIDLLLEYMKNNNLEQITGATSIMIMPGYQFRFVKGLITNFHQPKSTLILLIAAFTGSAWKEIYAHALNNDYRFLSYGDSSLLLK